MTPLQFATAECANHASDGSCKGIGIRNDGSLYSFGKKPACLLTQHKGRCRYFEECVLPMGYDTTTAKAIALANEHREAVRLYAVNAPRLARESGRICPDCLQRELEPGHRFCYACAAKRRKDTLTRANKGRVRVQQLLGKTPQNTEQNGGVFPPRAKNHISIADTPCTTVVGGNKEGSL